MQKISLRAIAISLTLLGLGASRLGALNQSNVPSPSIDLETIGPRIGDLMPDFGLRDQGGEVRTLKSLLRENGAIIVFFRSADW